MSKFLSKRLSQLEAYVPGEQPQGMKYIKLNTNESPYPPHIEVAEAVKSKAGSLNLYNDPTCSELCKAAAEVFGVKPFNILPTNGSDEALYFAYLAFGEDGVAYPSISYGFYPVYSDFTGIEATKVSLEDDFSVNPADYYNMGKTIIIANPNAPTGMALSLVDIELILKNNKDNLVIIDEAYIDFGGESAVSLIDKYSNLLVIQTFSKSRSLAGGRLGFAIGNEELINDLNLVKYSFNPYNVNALTQLAGVVTLKNNDYYLKNAKIIQETRDFTTRNLEKIGFTVLPSKANFIFAKANTISGETLYLKLKERGILVRHFNKEEIRDFVRITIGTMENMNKLIEVVNEVLKEGEV